MLIVKEILRKICLHYFKETDFSRKGLIAEFLKLLVKHKTFSFNFIKRLITNELRKRGYMNILVEEKPDWLDVEAMFDKDIFIPGKIPLDECTFELIVDIITQEHILSCSTCRVKGELHPSCYFNYM